MFWPKQAAVQQFQVTLHKLQHTPPEGRLVLHISSQCAALV